MTWRPPELGDVGRGDDVGRDDVGPFIPVAPSLLEPAIDLRGFIDATLLAHERRRPLLGSELYAEFYARRQRRRQVDGGTSTAPHGDPLEELLNRGRRRRRRPAGLLGPAITVDDWAADERHWWDDSVARFRRELMLGMDLGRVGGVTVLSTALIPDGSMAFATLDDAGRYTHVVTPTHDAGGYPLNPLGRRVRGWSRYTAGAREAALHRRRRR